MDLYDILVESICNSLRLIEFHLIDLLKHKSDQPIKPLQPFHFFLQDFGHCFTCLYPVHVDDDGKFLNEKLN